MNFEQTLDNYAQVLLRAGLQLMAGEGLVINLSEDGLPLARRVARLAYQLGAKDVQLNFSDDEMTLAFYEEARDEAIGRYPNYLASHLRDLYDDDYQHLIIRAANPALLKDVSPERIARQNKAVAQANAETGTQNYRMTGRTRWTIGAVASRAWARSVFPHLGEEQAIQKLWQAIFYASRADQADPLEAWRQHDADLHRRRDYLNDKNFTKLLYRGPGTDLEVYLAEGHLWVGGSKESTRGQNFIANVPTEEIFTTPHRARVNGRLRATKPLSLNGTLVEDFSFVFKDGLVVDFEAGKGAETLERQLNQDENSRRLGEIALVQDDSPISNMGIIFNNTLYDENASCHFALGQSYAYAMRGGTEMSAEELAAKGANKSLIHTDFMVGSKEVDVIAVCADGQEVPLLVGGNWLI